MQSIKDFLPEIITESFKSDFVRNLFDQMQSYRMYNLKNDKNDKYAGITFKELFANKRNDMLIEWDKITDDDIQIFEPEEIKMNKDLIRNLVKGQNKYPYLIFVFDDFNKSNVKYVISGVDGQCYEIENGRHSWRFSVAEALRICGKSKIAILNFGQMRNNVINKQRLRFDSQQGIVKHGDEEYNKKVALENLKRYQQIINARKAQNVDKKLVERIGNICNLIVTTTSKIQFTNQEQVQIMEDLLFKQNNLISDFRYYISRKRDIATQQYRTNPDFDKNSMNKYEKDFYQQIQEIETILKDKFGVTVIL